MFNLISKSKLIYWPCLTLFLTVLLASCSTSKPEFGKSLVKQYTDTATSKSLITKIRGIDNDIFEANSFTGKSNDVIKYRLLKPNKDVSTIKKLPLVIVFHGSGAVGSDNSKQMGALAKFWAEPSIKEKYPAYVVVPQFPARSSNYVLDSSRNVLVSIPQTGINTVLQLIDSLKRTLPIDEDKIYAVGFSMGASSVINVLSLRPDLFAAGVSISGIPQFTNINALSNIPIWLMHGNIDKENPIDSDLQFFKEGSIKNKTRFWEFENTAHNDIISPIVLGEGIPKWLFKRTK